ncbi:hypothetical protein ACIKT0_17565 [Hansschlegelia beijingensis]|uniref:hypothetical protein n=1 Tax=Hansschlegelia beijingensis TaxID=1133344 RepID=UPI00387F1D2F
MPGSASGVGAPVFQATTGPRLATTASWIAVGLFTRRKQLLHDLVLGTLFVDRGALDRLA